MTTPLADFELELRYLYEALPPPPPPSWGTTSSFSSGARVRSSRPHRLRRGSATRRLSWTFRGLVITGVASAAGAAIVTTTHHGPSAPLPSTGPQTRLLSVQVLPAGAGLTCSLPIVALSADQTRGFVVLHNGAATFQPADVPQGAYLAALHRWVDGVPRRLNDDDTTYYNTNADASTVTITVHDSRGARVVHRAPALGAGSPMGWFGGDIVLFQPDLGPGGPPREAHVMLLNPDTATLRTVPGGVALDSDFGANGSSTGYVAGSGAMWTTFSRTDGTRSTLNRYDLTTGVTTEVYASPGFIEMVGVDGGGHPIIQVGSRDIFHVDPAQRAGISMTTLLLTPAAAPTVLNRGRVGDPGVTDNLSPLSTTDGSSVWMAADNGQIWRYTPQNGMQLVAKLTTSTEGAPGVAIEGPCR